MDTNEWQQLPLQQQAQEQAAAVVVEQPDMATRMYGNTEAEPDSDTATPETDEVLGADGDDPSATTETEGDESDTGDGTPEEEESDESGYEQRFKDTQAKLTETAQELAQVRAEIADSAADIERARFEYQDKLANQEQVSQLLYQKAFGQYQQLQQVNPATLTQQQFTQWQQQLAHAGREAQEMQQLVQQLQGRSKEVAEQAKARDVAIARATLTRKITDFDAVYPEIGKFAVSKGVNQKVFEQITDPGLILILHEAMKAVTHPDVIETVTKQRQSTAPRQSQAKRVQSDATPKTLEQKMYPHMK